MGFAIIYRCFPNCVMVRDQVGGLDGFLHAVYFSVVTMTTLGFGDIYANPDSSFGQILLMFQVLLGYVLLGALVTRFAVLFTAGGPAGDFPGDKPWYRHVWAWMGKIFARASAAVAATWLRFRQICQMRKIGEIGKKLKKLIEDFRKRFSHSQ